MKFSLQNTKVRSLILGIIGLAVLVAAALTGLGLYGLSKSNDNMKTVYADRMVPIDQLNNIARAMLKNRAHLNAALNETQTIVGADKKPVLSMNSKNAAEEAQYIEEKIKFISETWSAYKATSQTPEGKALADNFAASRGKFVTEILKPAIVLLRANNYEELKKLNVRTRDLYNAAEKDLNALIELQMSEAKAEFIASEARFNNIRLISFSALGIATAILVWIGMMIAKAISNPLKQAIDVFGKVSQGTYDTPIEVKGSNELGQVLSSLKATQERLSANIAAQQEQAENFKEQATLFEGQLNAISNSTGVIEFTMDGKVTAVNDNFLKVLGYSREEAVGQQHSAFVDPAYRNSVEYRQFWEKLNRGEFQAGQFKRVGKGGREVWIQASYNPILCKAGKPYKVVKYATDITEQKLRNADFEGQISAIGKSQGVIELGLDGKILKVNETYRNMLGYTENELVGQHVSMVLDPTFAKSAAYAELWNRLVQGSNDSGQYKRIAKGGSEVWIQASYNPIYDLNGKPFKIVNYTMDITEQKLKAADNAGQLAAISKIQGVIEFDLTGKVTAVNENFASVTGYSEKEIVGSHHSMFVETAYKNSQEYKLFWDNLRKGEAQIGHIKRIGKGGKEIWLDAIYAPINDMNGKPFRVVKYATDITEQVNAQQVLAKAVEETQVVIQLAKSGDLTDRVSLQGKTGAIAQLCEGINALMDKFTEVVVQVKEAGETINTAAGEISTGNNDLSSRTEQQASSLEETASSMEELASTVKQNADNAKQANQLAAAASGVAVKGGEVVADVVKTMSAINDSAKKIEDIISVIDGIAFQTNILALNAAVEAARAGEQGRGFAVVAGEVRNLAQRSASAAKEIKELITDSVSKTAEGTKLVEDAGKTMDEIVSSVQRVTDIMGEISAASQEQSSGIEQVNTAITSMDEVTQQNAALVEEAAAAAESLVEQAASLMDTVNGFTVRGGNGVERRASNSPMRRPASNRSVGTSAPAKPVFAKTGTDDGDWEEF